MILSGSLCVFGAAISYLLLDEDPVDPDKFEAEEAERLGVTEMSDAVVA